MKILISYDDIELNYQIILNYFNRIVSLFNIYNKYFLLKYLLKQYIIWVRNIDIKCLFVIKV